MNQRQEAKFAMHNTVISLLMEFNELWKDKPAFSETVQQYQDKHDIISVVVKDKARKLAGVSTSKRNKKVSLAAVSLKNAGLLRAFASKTGNDELLAEMTFSRSELRYISDNKLGPVAKNIHDHLVKHKDEMVSYNITDLSIVNFSKQIDEYKTSSSSTHKARMVKKSLGVRLSTLLAELDSFLDNQVDQFMLDFEDSHPEFYESYHNCRLIVDPKTSPTQFAGIVTEEATGKVLKNVLVTVDGTNYLANSKADGNFKLPIPKPGEYKVSFEVFGYEVATASGELKLGKTTEMNIALKRIA